MGVRPLDLQAQTHHIFSAGASAVVTFAISASSQLQVGRLPQELGGREARACYQIVDSAKDSIESDNRCIIKPTAPVCLVLSPSVGNVQYAPGVCGR